MWNLKFYITAVQKNSLLAVTIKINNGHLSTCISGNLCVTPDVGEFQWLKRGFFSSYIGSTELDTTRSSEECETFGAPLSITAKTGYGDTGGRAPGSSSLSRNEERFWCSLQHTRTTVCEHTCLCVVVLICVGICTSAANENGRPWSLQCTPLSPPIQKGKTA